MNEHQATELLERLAGSIPAGVAPVDDLLEAGRRARRRRTVLGGGMGVVAAVGIVVAVSAVVPGAVGGHSADQPAVPANEPAAHPAIPSGMRLVGLNDVVVAVPQSWSTNDVRCGTPVASTVLYDLRVTTACLVPARPGVNIVRIFDTDSAEMGSVKRGALRKATINGVAVERSGVSCLLSDPPKCVESLVVPSAHVAFRVEVNDGSNIMNAITESLHSLPAGWVTVPAPPVADPAQAPRSADMVAELQRVGLVPQVVRQRVPGVPAGQLLSQSPAVGLPVRVGSTVTITETGL
ncbi:PASTA domain-containing protein [Pedococcus sp. 5OH_020]|uniref:PASTA domain-containing protein n=1 Tax=Pedococcus sp. 5OH_020 TaxID=2989814 RepID=UPI0022EA0F85|nr:PASTA domain-containing protein [Pedococcus sp. 5OH_020]